MKIFSTPFGNVDKFFFNISGNVGPNCPNKPEDVQLVQFAYFAMAQNKLPEIPPDLMAAAGAVVPGAPYSGSPNDPLTIAIRADERARGGTQDGHISVVRGNLQTYSADNFYLLVRLVNHIRKLLGKDFPRIDKHPKCPPQLAASVRQTFEVE
jgi:hypothetical protein